MITLKAERQSKMKRIIVTILSVLLLISMLSITTLASSEDGVLTLPEDDGTGYPITGISDSYSHDEDIVKVIVPENIVRLGDEAFYQCSNLNQIKLHSKIQRIGEKAFEGTAYFKDPDNWDKDGVLYIGDCLIKADPNKIPEVYEIRNGTRLIAAGAFRNCEKLNMITIPDTIEYVGEGAFAGTDFYNNNENWVNNTLAVEHVLIAVNEECTGNFVVHEGIKSIADRAFSHSKITEVFTPSSLEKIGQDAFWDCQNLLKVTLSKNVDALGRGPFRACNNLQEIIVHEDNESYAVVDGVLFDKQLSAVIRCPEAKEGAISLPHSVKRINAYAFEWCTKITSVEIPEGCVFIGNAAFSTCENLSYVTLPELLEYIDNSAFAYCNSLESVNVPDNVYYLGKWAFNCCMNLKSVEIGNGIEELRYCLFESCEKLNTVTLGENIKEIDDTAFLFTKYISNVSNYNNGLLIASDKYLIKVDKDVTACYIPSGVTVIADGAFEYPSEEGFLTEIHVPSSLVRFNYGAFYDVPNKTPVYYDGTIEDFIDITNFDWKCINLHTTDFRTTIWAVVALGGVFTVFTIGIIVIDRLKKRNMQETEEEDEYAEE